MSNFIRGRHAPSLPAFHLPDSTEGPHRGRPALGTGTAAQEGPSLPIPGPAHLLSPGGLGLGQEPGRTPHAGRAQGPVPSCGQSSGQSSGRGWGGTAGRQSCLGVRWARNTGPPSSRASGLVLLQASREQCEVWGCTGQPQPTSWDHGVPSVLHPHLGRGQSYPHFLFSLRATDGTWPEG